VRGRQVGGEGTRRERQGDGEGWRGGTARGRGGGGEGTRGDERGREGTREDGGGTVQGPVIDLRLPSDRPAETGLRDN